MKRSTKYYGQVLALLACLFFPGFTFGLEVKGDYHALSQEFAYLADPEGTLTLEQILAEPGRYPFKSGKQGSPQGSFTPFWLKLELTFGETSQQTRYLLYTRVENLYDIRLYRPDGWGGYDEWVTGNDYPAASREQATPRYGFQIEPSAQPMTVYLRYIGGPGTEQLPWDLVEEQFFERNSRVYYSFNLISLTAIAALLVFNFLIALSLRKFEYFFYSAYVFSVLMALITLDGFGFYYLWPDAPGLNERALHSFNLFSASMRLLTITSFLGIAAVAPRLYRAALGMLALLATTLLLVNLLGVSGLPIFSASIVWGLGILSGFVVVGYAIKKRVKLAIPLLITLLIPSIAALLQAFLTVHFEGAGIVVLQLAKIGFVIHVLLFSLCLAAHIKMETDSRIEALHDSLTGLPGPILLHEHYEMAANMSRRQDWKMAVFFIDLDGFKEVNDRQGHAVGDQLLVQVAGRMQGSLRSTDTVARIGGDEFVVLLIGVNDAAAVQQVADKLLTTVAAPYHLAGTEVRVSASIGIAMYPSEGEELEILIKAADGAMYESKRKGKNTCSFANTSLQQQTGHVLRSVNG